MNEPFDHQVCPICDAPIETPLTLVDYPVATPHRFAPNRIIECPTCGSGFADPMPTADEIAELYKGAEYWSSTDAVSVNPKSFPVPFSLAQSRWRWVLQSWGSSHDTSHLKILDVGAGPGCFGIVACEASPDSAIDYHAVEPDPSMRAGIEGAFNTLGDATVTTYEDIAEVGGGFDLVVASHVLEHVIDPTSFLKDILDRVRPGGFVFIEVPHCDYLFKPDVFPHVLFFNNAGLQTLLQRSGLSVWQSGVFGGRRSKSPLAAKRGSWKDLTGRILNRLRRFIPGSVSVKLYAAFFEVDQRNDNGVWLRMLAQKSAS